MPACARVKDTAKNVGKQTQTRSEISVLEEIKAARTESVNFVFNAV